MRRCQSAPFLIPLAFALSTTAAPAQTKLATLSLTPYGVMTQSELDKEHPVLDPPPEEKGFVTSGPPGGIATGGAGFLAIDSHDRIYVGLPLWAADFAPPNPFRGTGNKLRLLLLDPSAKPAVKWSTDFPTKSLYRLDLRLAADDAPLVLAGDKLMRLTPDAKPAQTLAVPQEGDEKYPVWDSAQSPTRRILRITPSEKHAIFIDTNTLTVLKNCHPASDVDYGTMTDDLEFTVQHAGQQVPGPLQLTQHPFCETKNVSAQPASPNAEYVAINNQQFLTLADNHLSLHQIAGKTLWTSASSPPLTSSTHFGQTELSRNGKRIAITLLRQIQYHLDSMNPSDIQNGTWDKLHTESLEDSIGVWDLATGHRVAVIPIANHAQQRSSDPPTQFALSPDGTILAVLKAGEVTVWKLP